SSPSATRGRGATSVTTPTGRSVAWRGAASQPHVPDVPPPASDMAGASSRDCVVAPDLRSPTIGGDAPARLYKIRLFPLAPNCLPGRGDRERRCLASCKQE